MSVSFRKPKNAEVLIHQSGADEYLVCPRGKEPCIINKKTFGIIMAILEAKSHEHIELEENEDIETNLQMMEAGL